MEFNKQNKFIGKPEWRIGRVLKRWVPKLAPIAEVLEEDDAVQSRTARPEEPQREGRAARGRRH